MRYLVTLGFMFLTLATDFFANVAMQKAHLFFLIAIVSISIFSFVFLIRRIFSLKKENTFIAGEQLLLINELEQTNHALDDYKEVAFQQQHSMKRIAMVLSHDLQSPFRFLVSSSESLYESIIEKESDNAATLSLEIKHSGEKMLVFLSDFTTWIKSISEGYKLKSEAVNLLDMFVKMEDFFFEQLKSRRNILSYEAAQAMEAVNTDKELLKIILRNLIDNANKYNSGCVIKVEAKKEEGNGVIIISDNGHGIQASVLEIINETLRQNTICVSETEDKQGYKFIAHFSKLLNLTTSIYSTSQQGTCVRLEGFNIA